MRGHGECGRRLLVQGGGHRGDRGRRPGRWRRVVPAGGDRGGGAKTLGTVVRVAPPRSHSSLEKSTPSPIERTTPGKGTRGVHLGVDGVGQPGFIPCADDDDPCRG